MTTKPKAAATEDRPKYFMLTQFRERGWTDTLIAVLLGNPDDERTNRRYKNAAPIQLYLQDRVIVAEQSEAWAIGQAAAAAHREAGVKGTKTKTRNLLARIDCLTIHVPVVPMKKIYREACEFRRATGERERDAVNFIRHELTEYDQNIDDLYRQGGRGEGYKRLNQRIYEAIAAAYPELADECRRQMARKFGADTLLSFPDVQSDAPDASDRI